MKKRKTLQAKKKDIAYIQSAKTVNDFWRLYINIYGIEKAENLYRFMERTIQHTKEINNADNFNFGQKKSVYFFSGSHTCHTLPYQATLFCVKNCY